MNEIGGKYVNPQKRNSLMCSSSIVYVTYIHSFIHSASIYETLNHYKDLGLWEQIDEQMQKRKKRKRKMTKAQLSYSSQ